MAYKHPLQHRADAVLKENGMVGEIIFPYRWRPYLQGTGFSAEDITKLLIAFKPKSISVRAENGGESYFVDFETPLINDWRREEWGEEWEDFEGWGNAGRWP